MFGVGGIYNVLLWGFLVGALLPLPFYFLTRRYPNSWVRYVHVPVLIIGGLGWVPTNLTYLWPTLIVGFIFNYYIKNRWVTWWQRYAYVLTSSFSAGIAISALIIFFSLEYTNKYISWWGNNVVYAGVDGGGSANECALLPIPASGSF